MPKHARNQKQNPRYHPNERRFLECRATEHFLEKMHERKVAKPWITEMLVKRKECEHKHALITTSEFWHRLERNRTATPPKSATHFSLVVIAEGRTLITVKWCPEPESWTKQKCNEHIMIQWIM